MRFWKKPETCSGEGVVMENIKLIIVSPDGTLYNGAADFIKIRTINGDIGIRGKHANYFSVISFAECMVENAEETKYAACSDGYISVKNKSEVKIVATTFEWAEIIDSKRAQRAYENAQQMLESIDNKNKDYRRYQDKLKRAQIRIKIANSNLSERIVKH